MSFRSIAAPLLAAAALTAACGRTAQPRATPPDARGADAPDPAPAAVSGPAEAGARPDASAAVSCEPVERALAARWLSPRDGRLTCAVVVRLDHDSLRLLGYQDSCGRYAAMTEAQAREAAQRGTGYGAAGSPLHLPAPEDAFVFHDSTGDFGGVAVVSPRLGQAVFGGSIVWAGRGDITWPAAWRDPAELGGACDPAGGIPRVRSYDLVRGAVVDPAAVDRAVDVVAHTAVPGALWRGGYVFDAVVLRYPRTVGAFEPATAEWVVIVNGGWLE